MVFHLDNREALISSKIAWGTKRYSGPLKNKKSIELLGHNSVNGIVRLSQNETFLSYLGLGSLCKLSKLTRKNM